MPTARVKLTGARDLVRRSARGPGCCWRSTTASIAPTQFTFAQSFLMFVAIGIGGYGRLLAAAGRQRPRHRPPRSCSTSGPGSARSCSASSSSSSPWSFPAGSSVALGVVAARPTAGDRIRTKEVESCVTALLEVERRRQAVRRGHRGRRRVVRRSKPAHVLGLIGPNGSGKTTLLGDPRRYPRADRRAGSCSGRPADGPRRPPHRPRRDRAHLPDHPAVPRWTLRECLRLAVASAGGGAGARATSEVGRPARPGRAPRPALRLAHQRRRSGWR